MELHRYFLLLLAILFYSSLSAIDLYVSPVGNDDNPGTKKLPLATLTGARNAIRNLRSENSPVDGINVIIMDGSYYLTKPLFLTEEDSGDKNFQIVYRAASGANPVFKGGIEIGGWEKVSDKLWRAKVPETSRYGLYFEQLYVNGRRAVRARTPNDGFYHIQDISEIIIDPSTVIKENFDSKVKNLAIQRISIYPSDSHVFHSFTKKDFENAIVTFYHKWDITRKRIASFNIDSSTIYTIGNSMKSWNMLDNKTRYIIENYKDALDTAGEWYLDRSGYLYYIPRNGEKIENLHVLAPVLSKFIVISGNESKRVENICFDNLHFVGTGYLTPMSGNEPSQAATPIEASIMIDYARGIKFINCEITHTGNYAVWFRKACEGISVEHCYLHDLGAGGIKIGDVKIPDENDDLTRNIVVDNNIIQSGGFIFPCAVGIIIYQSSDNNIIHNDIADFRYTAISVGWVWGYNKSPSKRNHIEYNHIHHIGWGVLSDMGGIYCLGKSEGTTVRNNVIHHIYSIDYGGWGLYTDEGSTGILLQNNLVYACKSSAFHQHYGRNNIIKNNIFAFQIRAQLEATRVEPHSGFRFIHNIVYYNEGNLAGIRWDQANFIADSNAYWDTRTRHIMVGKQTFKEWQKSGKDVHSIIADPGFVNPEGNNFRLKNNKIAEKIGFKSFDYSKAGVYGNDDWIKLSRLDPEIRMAFDQAVIKGEKTETGK